MKFFRMMVPIIFFIGLIAGCQSPAEHNTMKDDVRIYTSIYPIQFIIEELVGDFADVHTVYPPGVDAHTYEPSTKDMIDISNSKAFIYLGAGMESFAETTVEALASSDVEFIEIGKHEELFDHADDHDDHEHHDHHGHDHGDLDPHIWFDPERMTTVAELMKEEMIYLFPEKTDAIEENYEHMKEAFTSLDHQYAQTLLPKKNKKMIVSHAAYGYWEERYGIEQIPISGISASEEPSQKELAHLIEQANEENMTYVFFEQNTSNKVATIIQEHLHATPLYIHNLEVLTEEDIANNENYLTLMERNIRVLDEGIQ